MDKTSTDLAGVPDIGRGRPRPVTTGSRVRTSSLNEEFYSDERRVGPR